MRMNHDILSRNLKLLRTINNISQEDLAEEIHLSRSTYSTYETGTKVPDLQTIDALAGFYNVGFDSLAGYDLSGGLLYRIYFEQEDPELVELLNSYENLSISSKNIVMERLDTLLEREKVFYNELISSSQEDENS